MQKLRPVRLRAVAVFIRMLYLAKEKRYGHSDSGFGVSSRPPA